MVHFNVLICSISLYNLLKLWNFICHARANFLDLPCSTEIELSGVSRTSLPSININSYRLYLTFFDYSVTFYFYSEIFSKEFPIKWNTWCAIHNNLFVMKFMILNLLLITLWHSLFKYFLQSKRFVIFLRNNDFMKIYVCNCETSQEFCSHHQ